MPCMTWEWTELAAPMKDGATTSAARGGITLYAGENTYSLSFEERPAFFTASHPTLSDNQIAAEATARDMAQAVSQSKDAVWRWEQDPTDSHFYVAYDGVLGLDASVCCWAVFMANTPYAVINDSGSSLQDCMRQATETVDRLISAFAIVLLPTVKCESCGHVFGEDEKPCITNTDKMLCEECYEEEVQGDPYA